MNKKNTKPNELIRSPGVSDFKKLIQEDYKFVDKTLFIKEIIEDGAKVIVITRPRRFGKHNLSMLYHFLRYKDKKEENLFKNLAISQYKDFCKTHQHQYPVIFISFKDIKQKTYEESRADIITLIQSLYEEHRYLIEDDTLSDSQQKKYIKILEKTSDLSDIRASLGQLSLYMQEKFNKNPIILIDEYDTPIQEAYLKGYYNEMIDLMRSIFGEALKDNEYLNKGIITGITRVAQESLFSGVNNLEVYSMLRQDYGQYFGFSEEEVVKLMDETEQQISIDEVRGWYNSYQIYQYTLYNPWSIVSCLTNEGKLEPYWINTSSNDLIKSLLVDAATSVKHKLEILLQGKSIEQAISENLVLEIKTQADSLWSLLISAGYLKVLATKFDEIRGLIAKITIPNKEVAYIYNKIIETWIDNTFGIDSYDEFVISLYNEDLEKFKIYLSNYLVQTSSYFDFSRRTSEQTFHVFILGLVLVYVNTTIFIQIENLV